MENDVLKQIPIKALDFSKIKWDTRLQFYQPAAATANLSDGWNPSCNVREFFFVFMTTFESVLQHARSGEWEEGKDQNWMTIFTMPTILNTQCRFCCPRLECQLEDWKTRSPDEPVTVLFTASGTCFVDFQFVDPKDGVTEWRYMFMYKFSLEELKNLGGTV